MSGRVPCPQGLLCSHSPTTYSGTPESSISLRNYHVPSIPLQLQGPPCPQNPTISPGSIMSPAFHCVSKVPMSPRSHHVPSATPRVPPSTQDPPHPTCPGPWDESHLGTPARGLPSDAPGTGSRHGLRSRAGTGTALSPAASGVLSWAAHWAPGGQRGRAGCRGLTASQAGCRECVGWHPQGSQPPSPPRLQKWGAQRSQLLPTTLGRQAQAPVPWSQLQEPVVQWEARVPRGSQPQPVGDEQLHGAQPVPPTQVKPLAPGPEPTHSSNTPNPNTPQP